MSDQDDEIIAAAMLLGAEFETTGSPRDRRLNLRWIAGGNKVITGSYSSKLDAAHGYLLKLGYHINAAGELQEINPKR